MAEFERKVIAILSGEKVETNRKRGRKHYVPHECVEHNSACFRCELSKTEGLPDD